MEPQLQCRECIRLEKDGVTRYICAHTGKPQHESPDCPNLRVSGQDESFHAGADPAPDTMTSSRNEETLRILLSQQDFRYAAAGGFLVMLICAVGWSGITVATGMQNGWMAIFTGIITGLSIAFFGGGIDKKFGYLGVFYAFLACFTGNFFSQVMFLADQEGSGYLETLLHTDYGLARDMIVWSYSPVDFIFYGLAVAEGYLLSFRRPNSDSIASIRSRRNDGKPGYFRYRSYVILACLMVLLAAFFAASKKVNGLRTSYYDTGNKRSEGNYSNSRQHGAWTYFYSTGVIQAEGQYRLGIPDSNWTWYHPDGSISRKGNYRQGFEEGAWTSYYAGNQLLDSGAYHYGRKTGTWKSWHRNGNLKEQGEYYKDAKHGPWLSWHDNGLPESELNYHHGILVGSARRYFPDGRPFTIAEYDSTGREKLHSSWTPSGRQLVVDGNGNHQVFSRDGFLLLEETVQQGLRNGPWNSYYTTGALKESGRYDQGTLLLLESWDRMGNQQVRDGNGLYISYYPDDSTTQMLGQIRDGLRSGIWKFYNASGTIQQEIRYSRGIMEGMQKSYYENGLLYHKGWMKSGKKTGTWEWYNYQGEIFSKADYSATEGKEIRYFYNSEGKCIYKEE